jgi:DNA-binding LacI/PurR family transcriptional regulator
VEREQAVNIYDIAREAGVSSATVSRVINDSPKVRPETAQRVREVMARMQFTPNVFAQSLQSNSMKVIAVVTVDISDIYFAVAIQEIEQYARRHGYEVQVSFAGRRRSDQLGRIEAVVEKRVDGLILAGSAFVNVDAAISTAMARTPVVLLNGSAEGENVYSVVCDDGVGIELAVDHLAGSGRTDIVYVSKGRIAAARAKVAGYRRAMRRHGLTPRVFETIDGAVPAALAVWAEQVDRTQADAAVVAGDDPLAALVIKELRRSGLRVPTDVAVTGYDNLDFATITTPSLTSVDGHAARISRITAKVLIDALEGREPARVTRIPPELVVRESSWLPSVAVGMGASAPLSTVRFDYEEVSIDADS